MKAVSADMTREKLERKVEYCRELLELADTIDPGMSLFRGTLLFELQAALVALAKMLLSNDILTKDGTQVSIVVFSPGVTCVYVEPLFCTLTYLVLKWL